MKVALASNHFGSYFAQHFGGFVQVVDADLVIFTGGEDIHPRLYGEGFNGALGVNNLRDAQEVAVYKLASKLGKKMLGVCRGHQLLMALNGGKLVQNIPNHHPGTHSLEVFNEELVPLSFVNSMHHQGILIADVPKTFEVTSVYEGIVESTHSDKITTVQWHPEFLDYSEGKIFFDFAREWVNNG